MMCTGHSLSTFVLLILHQLMKMIGSFNLVNIQQFKCVRFSLETTLRGNWSPYVKSHCTFNKSTDMPCLPDDFKKASVTPIYKGKGSHDDQGYYRPISVIPHAAKVLEKRVQSRLCRTFNPISHLLYSINFPQSSFNNYSSARFHW